MISNYPQRLIALILLLSYLLTSCSWEKGKCGYEADRCRQPGKEGHGKYIIQKQESSSVTTSRSRSPLRESGEACRERARANFEVRQEIADFILETLSNEFKKELNLEELEELKKKTKFWLERVNWYGSFNYRIESNEEAEKKLREALDTIERKKAEIDANLYEAEQEASGIQKAKISAEVGRPIEYTLIPGNKISFPFLAQFTHVDIQVEPGKNITLTHQYQDFLKPFKRVSIDNKIVKGNYMVVRRILYSDGFIKVKASMQGENSFTIRPVDSFNMEVLVYPGEKLRKDWLSSFKQVNVLTTHDTITSGTPQEIPSKNKSTPEEYSPLLRMSSLISSSIHKVQHWIDPEVLRSKGLMKILASTQGEERFTITKSNSLRFSLQPGERVPIPFLELFKDYTIQATHDAPTLGKLGGQTTGFMDIEVSTFLSEDLPNRTTLQRKTKEYIELFRQDKALEEALSQLTDVNTQIEKMSSIIPNVITMVSNFFGGKVEDSPNKLNEALQRKKQLEKQIFASALYQQGIQLIIQAEQRRQTEENEAEYALIASPYPASIGGSNVRKIIEAGDYKHEARIIQEECITPLRIFLTHRRSNTSGMLFKGSISNQDKVEALVDASKFLGKFGIKSTALTTWQNKLGVQKGSGKAKFLYQRLTQEIKQEWESCQEYQIRIKVARKFKRQVNAYRGVFDVDVSAEVLQLVLGEPIIQEESKEEKEGISTKSERKVGSNQAKEDTKKEEKDYDFSGGEKIPHAIQLDNGKTVHIDFGNSEDGISADHAVNPKLVAALKTFLNNASKSCDFQTVYISSTTNGKHSAQSNHYVENARALDISRIDGKPILEMGPKHPHVIAFQNALESLPNIRENFGPTLFLKEGKPHLHDNLDPKTYAQRKKDRDAHFNHIHFSVNP